MEQIQAESVTESSTGKVFDIVLPGLVVATIVAAIFGLGRIFNRPYRKSEVGTDMDTVEEMEVQFYDIS